MTLEALCALRDKLIMLDVFSEEEKNHMYATLQEQILEASK
jgi:hypothetical protein